MIVIMACLASTSRPTFAASTPDYVVDTNFPACIPNLPLTSYTSIHDAVAAITTPGHTLYVCPGTYTEPTITVNASILTIMGPGATPADDGVALVKKRADAGVFAFDVSAGAVDDTISGLTIDATPPVGFSGYTGAILWHAPYGTITDNEIYGANESSIVIGNAGYLIDMTIERNVIFEASTVPSSSHAIGCTCTYSTIQDNTFDMPMHGQAVFLNGPNVNFLNNVVYGGVIMVSDNGLMDGNLIDGDVNDTLLAEVMGDQIVVSNNNFRNTLNAALQIRDPIESSATTTNATIIKNQFNYDDGGIRLLDTIPGDARTITATIGGSEENANVFDHSGTSLQLLSLAGIASPINATFNDWGLCSLSAIEEKITHHPDNPDLGTVDYDPFIAGSTCATPTPTLSPTPSATPSSTPSPSPTSASGQHRQGDLNCNGVIDGRDALLPLLAQSGALATTGAGCPELGSDTPPFGDVDCMNGIGAQDSLAILAHTAHVAEFAQLEPCTDIGQLLP